MKKSYLTILVFTFLAVFYSNSASYDEYDEIVLKDSTMICGKITEIVPGTKLSITDFNDSLIRINMDDIMSMKRRDISELKFIEKPYPEFGISIGTPSGVNLSAGYWFGLFGLRVSGMSLGTVSGFQFNAGIKLIDSPDFMQNLVLVAGSTRIEDKQYSFFGADKTVVRKWDFMVWYII